METIRKRQAYIDLKLKQHKGITNMYKYQHRLKRLMRYHRLLTEIEVAEIRKMVGD